MAPTRVARQLAAARSRLSRLPHGTVEALLGLVMAVLTVAVFPLRADDRLGLALELLICLSVALVGRWPVPASVAALVFMTALLPLPPGPMRGSTIVILVAITSLGAQGVRWPRLFVTVWFFVVRIVIENSPPLPPSQRIASSAAYVFMVGTAWLVGNVLHRMRAERQRSVIDRQAAVQAQRRSIARDLHDTIAYSTTLIIVRAQQAKLRGIDDPLVEADLDYIITAGRNSMRDLRSMMETLRRNDPDAAPHSPWQVQSLEEVLRARTAELQNHGFKVTSHVDAEPTTMPESVREALGKVLVEATSNMVKHGDPSGPVRILIERTDDDVEAVFINRVSSENGVRVETSQLGLVGARERVEALGGEIDVASESPEWVVRVRIPVAG